MKSCWIIFLLLQGLGKPPNYSIYLDVPDSHKKHISGT